MALQQRTDNDNLRATMSLLIFGMLFVIALQDGFHVTDLIFVVLAIVLFCLECKEPKDNHDKWMGY